MSAAAGKIAAVHNHFAALHNKLICPICHQPLQLTANSFKCVLGHCFDLSAHNYLNLAPQKNQITNKYNAALFNARRQVFAAGLYSPLLQKLLNICTDYQHTMSAERTLSILDAGCGEGYFAANLQQQIQSAEVLALDLARSALQMAAKTYRQSGLYCLIADLANLPLPDDSMDVILNLLSPANYHEFKRVLKPGGLLIKVIPGSQYLAEVRDYLKIPAQAALEEQQAAKLWQQTFPQAQETFVTYQQMITPDLAAAFLQMSPLSFNHSPLTQANDNKLFTNITIDLKILTAYVKTQTEK